eukprot:7891_1
MQSLSCIATTTNCIDTNSMTTVISAECAPCNTISDEKALMTEFEHLSQALDHNVEILRSEIVNITINGHSAAELSPYPIYSSANTAVVLLGLLSQWYDYRKAEFLSSQLHSKSMPWQQQMYCLNPDQIDQLIEYL